MYLFLFILCQLFELEGFLLLPGFALAHQCLQLAPSLCGFLPLLQCQLMATNNLYTINAVSFAVLCLNVKLMQQVWQAWVRNQSCRQKQWSHQDDFQCRST